MELEAGIKEMQRELEELRVAERVIGRLGSEDDDDTPPVQRAPRARTVGDLILEVLGAYGALESRDIFEKVREIQDTTFNTVSTTLSRLKDQGLVALEGRLWSQNLGKEATDLLLESPGPQGSRASEEPATQVHNTAERTPEKDV
ncbi:hypothetical protein [Roseixanthobacter liquoris]|uniref:hypothetical protein n=1 Tax=Roseixanthobacter liquoris TaxID=3119921 RepID=UPI0037285D64